MRRIPTLIRSAPAIDESVEVIVVSSDSEEAAAASVVVVSDDADSFQSGAGTSQGPEMSSAGAGTCKGPETSRAPKKAPRVLSCLIKSADPNADPAWQPQDIEEPNYAQLPLFQSQRAAMEASFALDQCAIRRPDVVQRLIEMQRPNGPRPLTIFPPEIMEAVAFDLQQRSNVPGAGERPSICA